MPRETVYDSRSIATYLVSKGASNSNPLDALQVMKLSYIAHGFTLALCNKPLVEDDVEAWKYGPVIRRIYSVLPPGQQPITNLLQAVPPPELEPNDRGILDSVYEKYSALSGLHLSTLTHREGSPWHQTWTTYGQNAVIPKDLIRKHYCDVLKAWTEAHAKNQPYWPNAL